MSTQQEIQQLAYELWEKDGKPQGKDQHYYFEAERQLRERKMELQREPSSQAPVGAKQSVKTPGRTLGASRTASETRPRRRSNSTK